MVTNGMSEQSQRCEVLHRITMIHSAICLYHINIDITFMLGFQISLKYSIDGLPKQISHGYRNISNV